MTIARVEELARLSDAELILSLNAAVMTEHAARMELLYALIAIERRRLAIQRGYSSMFDYAIRGLKYTGGAAYRRISTARAIRDHEVVHRALLERRLTLTTTSLLYKVLNAENASRLVEAASGQSQEAVAKLVAAERPAEAVRDRMVPIRSPKPQDAPPPTPLSEPVVAPARAESGPASDVRFKMILSVSVDVREKFDEVRNLMSSKLAGPGQATYEAILDELMEEYLDRHSPDRRKARRDARPARGGDPVPSAGPSERTRHVPVALHDDVHVRDGGRCTFVGPDGVRCGSRWDLEVHHQEPFAKGGPTDEAHTTTYCRAHNLEAARQDYGPGFIDQAIRARGGRGRDEPIGST